MGVPTTKKIPVIERLLRHVHINTVTGCWEWTGYLTSGYGKISLGGKGDGTDWAREDQLYTGERATVYRHIFAKLRQGVKA